MKHTSDEFRSLPLKEQVRRKKGIALVYLILRILVILTMISQFFHGNYEYVAMCILTLILFTLPAFIERKINIDLPDTLEVIILLFIFAAEILGEVQSYYTVFPYWDTMLHTTNGFLCAAVGFALVDLLNRDKHFSFSLSPVYLAVVAFCFSMTVGVLWEFFECSADLLLHVDMQKDTVINVIGSAALNPDGSARPLIISGIADTILVLEDGTQIPLEIGGYLDVGILDTMEDLLVNFIGASVFSVIGYFYVKNRGKGSFASRFIPKVLPSRRREEEPSDFS